MAHPKEKIENLVSEQDSCIQILQNIDKYDEVNKDISKEESNSDFFRQPFVKDIVERYLDLKNN